MKKPNTQNNQNTQNGLERNLITFQVSKVKVWEDGRVSFNIVINDVAIYNCRVVESDKGDFVSFPSRKGSDGKYYSHAYIKLTETENNAIIAEVERQLNGN